MRMNKNFFLPLFFAILIVKCIGQDTVQLNVEKRNNNFANESFERPIPDSFWGINIDKDTILHFKRIEGNKAIKTYYVRSGLGEIWFSYFKNKSIMGMGCFNKRKNNNSSIFKIGKWIYLTENGKVKFIEIYDKNGMRINDG